MECCHEPGCFICFYGLWGCRVTITKVCLWVVLSKMSFPVFHPCWLSHFLAHSMSTPDSGLQPVCLLPDGSEWCGGSLWWSNATCPGLELALRVSLRSAYHSHSTRYNPLLIPGTRGIQVKFNYISITIASFNAWPLFITSWLNFVSQCCFMVLPWTSA